MPRSVNHVASRARRKRILEFAKGYWGRRKNVWTVAKNAVEKGWGYAYRDRKAKKRNFRALWIQRINAATRMEGLSYSKFMSLYHNSGMEMNRKVLADLAMNHPAAFKAVVDYAKSNGTKATVAAKPAPKAEKAPKKEAVAAAEAPIVAEVETTSEETSTENDSAE
jgi:large subunit ribosomal protein L20